MGSRDDIDNDEKKGVFHTYIVEPFQTVPCTRTAYLHGFASGLIGGVSTFLFTSNVRRASNLGVLTFAVVMPGSFFYCRWKNFKKELEKERSRSSSRTDIGTWRPDETTAAELKET